MAELLFELFSEEIPARMQLRAANDLARLVADELGAAGLEFSTPRAFVTPRRLVVVVDGVPADRADISEERRGPRADAPDKAIAGFLKANGLESVDQCERRETPKGAFWFAITVRPGGPTAALLPDILSKAVARLAWPKSMRWGSGTARWVRPLRRGLCVFDGAPVPVSLPGGSVAGNETEGHRFMAPGVFAVKDFAEYRDKLRAAYVVLERDARIDEIATRARALADGDGLTLREDDALLEEVAGLVEWPVPLMGRIDDAFMEVPAEVLTTAMRSHQRYFALQDKDGALAPRFIVVANIDAPDGGAQIVAGNERVLRARLADAKFFWDQDRKEPLASRLPALGDVVFHAKLGTLAEKADRLQALAGNIAQFVPDAPIDEVRRAAMLAKADLTTSMVGEFPDLQGVMGKYYARADGEPATVAQAIEAHYRPAGPGEQCPNAPVSVAVALADRVDTLIGFFAIGEVPTGSKDPYALRRAALGVIRLILENKLRLSLTPLLVTAHGLYPALAGDAERVAAAVLDFIADRLKVHLRGEGVRHDLIAAIFSLGGEDDLVRLLARVSALEAFVASEDGANLLTAHKRASNIVAIEEKRDGAVFEGAPEPALLVEPAEKSLLAALDAARDDYAPLLKDESFDGAMAVLARLRAPVDQFFDDVQVNCDDPDMRANRLKLLAKIRSTMGGLAAFSQIEGQQS